jgi:hypothetical protein
LSYGDPLAVMAAQMASPAPAERHSLGMITSTAPLVLSVDGAEVPNGAWALLGHVVPWVGRCYVVTLGDGLRLVVGMVS